MKKNRKQYLGLGLLLILLLFGFAFFHVSGREIDGLAEMDDTCTVTVRAYDVLDYENRTEAVLDAAGAAEVKALLMGGSFRRVLADWVSFDTRNMYDILIDFNDGQNYISISVLGNEYLSVTNQFNDKHLRIHDKDFEATLLSILAAAEN